MSPVNDFLGIFRMSMGIAAGRDRDSEYRWIERVTCHKRGFHQRRYAASEASLRETGGRICSRGLHTFTENPNDRDKYGAGEGEADPYRDAGGLQQVTAHKSDDSHRNCVRELRPDVIDVIRRRSHR